MHPSKIEKNLNDALLSAQHKALLDEINRDLPFGLDWKRGALKYVAAEIAKHGREFYTKYLLSKPFSPVTGCAPGQPRSGGVALVENCAYLANFINAAAIIDLPGGSRVLDVACGSGWVAQYFLRMGYDAYGFDISEDMVDLARQRILADTLLVDSVSEILFKRIFCLNIEKEPLPDEFNKSFDAIILESCLHHFFDPITALENLAKCLRDDGLLVIIEGENRVGQIRPEYLSVMTEFATLERPYSRHELERTLDLVGFPFREFVGRLNGWFSPKDPRVLNLPNIVRGDSDSINFAICSKSPEPLHRVFPFLSL